MSLLLDQRLVEEIAACCPDQFLTYYNCLGKGDASKCFEDQKKLSDCVTTQSPSFKKIIANCSEQMNIYEDCIKEHPDFRTRCFDKLSDMRACVRSVLEVRKPNTPEEPKK